MAPEWSRRNLTSESHWAWQTATERRLHLVASGSRDAPTTVSEGWQSRGEWSSLSSTRTKDGHEKLGDEFDRALGAQGCQAKKLLPRSPQLNAFAERWIRSIKRECMDHFVAFGCGHLDYLVEPYVEHYYDERPHQGLGNRLLQDTNLPSDPGGRFVRRTRLGGVLKHYERRAD